MNLCISESCLKNAASIEQNLDGVSLLCSSNVFFFSLSSSFSPPGTLAVVVHQVSALPPRHNRRHHSHLQGIYNPKFAIHWYSFSYLHTFPHSFITLFFSHVLSRRFFIIYFHVLYTLQFPLLSIPLNVLQGGNLLKYSDVGMLFVFLLLFSISTIMYCFMIRCGTTA